MCKESSWVSHRVLRAVVTAVVLSIAVEAVADCRVSARFYNDQRRVPGEVNVECTWPHDDDGWGNWGIISNYGGVRDSFQFAGHKLIDNKRQWQSCTSENPPPSCYYYNDDCTKQMAAPDNRRSYASHYYIADGVCEDIGVVTVGNVFMHVYELDSPDADDHVASLQYGDMDIDLECASAWICSGNSEWVSASSGGGTIAARVQIEVRTALWNSSGR